MAINKNACAFVKLLGARVAELHNARNITQAEVAEHLGVSLQTG